MNEPTHHIHFGDCIAGMAEKLAPNSVDLCVSSIPFGALFMYSGKNEDIGNNDDGTDMRAGMFGLHMRFFVEQLLRVMKPGTNVCIHIQQLLRYKNQHGYMGRRDFRGAVIDLFTGGGYERDAQGQIVCDKHGQPVMRPPLFEWKGEVAIPKNPQLMAKRLNLHCLMFQTGKNNARDLAPAVNDYIMFFQKPGEATPVRALFDPQENPRGWVSTEDWIKWASGVWGDIREIDVLEAWRNARETDDEKHVCPLQLEPVRRCVKLFTNPGELVLDPFMGIGTVAHVALEQGRCAVGFELKESYHAQAVRNCEKATLARRIDQRGLFDGLEAEEALALEAGTEQTGTYHTPIEVTQEIMAASESTVESAVQESPVKPAKSSKKVVRKPKKKVPA